MFGMKVKEVKEVTGKRKIIVETVQSCIAPTNMEHLQEMAKVTARPEFCGGLTATIMSALRNKNLGWVVTRREILRRFRYAASVKGPPRDSPVRVGLGSAVMYTGDIPHFALLNIEIASECGLSYFTIHSLHPLPMATVICDPVILGWAINPLINLFPAVTERVPEMALGIIIAVWGQEGEELRI